MTEQSEYDVIILGGGAAGLMCAYSAGAAGRSVLILEKGRRIGGKIAISGGGKCNFTNMDCSADNFYCGTSHFVKSALARFSQWDFIAMLDQAGVGWQEREHGRLFCVHSAGEIVTMLENMCRAMNVRILCNHGFGVVSGSEKGFVVQSGLESYSSRKLVVACGGSAWPQCGAGPDGYQLARQFGLAVIEPEPALVPLRYGKADLGLMGELTGNSIHAVASCRGYSFCEELLFTHTGLSGPAILQVSNLWRKGDSIGINFLPEMSLREEIELARKSNGRTTVSRLLLGKLPQKFIRIWQQRYWPEIAVANLTTEQIESCVCSLTNWQFCPAGSEGFSRAEATRGGVSCDELSSKDMQARKVPGLHFIGEVVDVVGQLGGYNLQWAWSSGFCCGQSL